MVAAMTTSQQPDRNLALELVRVTSADPAPGSEGRRFGDTNEFEREVAVRLLRGRHSRNHSSAWLISRFWGQVVGEVDEHVVNVVFYSLVVTCPVPYAMVPRDG